MVAIKTTTDYLTQTRASVSHAMTPELLRVSKRKLPGPTPAKDTAVIAFKEPQELTLSPEIPAADQSAARFEMHCDLDGICSYLGVGDFASLKPLGEQYGQEKAVLGS